MVLALEIGGKEVASVLTFDEYDAAKIVNSWQQIVTNLGVTDYLITKTIPSHAVPEREIPTENDAVHRPAYIL